MAVEKSNGALECSNSLNIKLLELVVCSRVMREIISDSDGFAETITFGVFH